jgi:hypothetical protein
LPGVLVALGLAAGDRQPLADRQGRNRHFYEYVNTPTASWNARAAAGPNPGVPRAPGDDHERRRERNLYTRMGLSDMRAWIGLSDPAGNFSWRWITGGRSYQLGGGDQQPRRRAGRVLRHGAWNNN